MLDIKDVLKQIQAILFKRSNNIQLAGLDIGQESLKLLKIKHSSHPYEVENFAIVATPPKAIVKAEIKDSYSVASALRELIQTAGLSTRNVAVAIPRSLAISKTVMIDPRLTPEEIESRAWIEARHHFPDIVDDIYLDFTISQQSPDNPKQAELTLVACRKDQINPYLEVLKQCDLVVQVVDVNCYALERGLNLMMQETSQENVAVLNLDMNLSSLIVVNKGVMIHAHDQNFEAQRLINQTQGFKQAHPDIIHPIQDEGYKMILQENLITHLRQIIHFFYSSHANTSIQKIVLTGECVMQVPDLAAFITQEFGIETEAGNPLANMRLAEGISEKDIYSNAAALMLCSGLALSNTAFREKVKHETN